MIDPKKPPLTAVIEVNSEDPRLPFKQACDGRHTFYRRLAELAPQLRRIPVVHCCIFPRAPFDLTPNLSVQPWELMDGRAFRRFNSGQQFCADLQSRIDRSVSADASLMPLKRALSSGNPPNGKCELVKSALDHLVAQLLLDFRHLALHLLGHLLKLPWVHVIFPFICHSDHRVHREGFQLDVIVSL